MRTKTFEERRRIDMVIHAVRSAIGLIGMGWTPEPEAKENLSHYTNAPHWAEWELWQALVIGVRMASYKDYDNDYGPTHRKVFSTVSDVIKGIYGDPHNNLEFSGNGAHIRWFNLVKGRTQADVLEVLYISLGRLEREKYNENST